MSEQPVRLPEVPAGYRWEVLPTKVLLWIEGNPKAKRPLKTFDRCRFVSRREAVWRHLLIDLGYVLHPETRPWCPLHDWDTWED